MDKRCRIHIQYGYPDEKTNDIWHVSHHIYMFNNYRICGLLISLLDLIKNKDKDIEHEYRLYNENFRD